jgi:hypothetical protein
MLTLQQDIQREIEEIMEGLKCPKDFICYKSGFRVLCKAKDVGLESFIACLASNPYACKFPILYGGAFFCQCPLRIWIAKNLRK